MHSILSQSILLRSLTATSLALLALIASCSGPSGSVEYPMPTANCGTKTQQPAAVQQYGLAEGSKTLSEIQNGGGSSAGTASGSAAGTAAGTATGTATGAPAGTAGQSPQEITFYGTLYPILLSSSETYAFKCLACHVNYSTPESMNNVPELTRVVESMRSGRMPRSPSKVPEGYIKMFELWRAAGFPPGDANAKATTLPPLPGAGGTGTATGTTTTTANATGCTPAASGGGGGGGGW